MSASRIAIAWLVVGALGLIAEARTHAAKTAHPVVFAHGMGGFDDILGFDYWGDDYGTFVGDPCDKFLEFACNRRLHSRQKAFVAQVQAFESSEVRGLDLAEEIEGVMATMGTRAVNIIGHSQGGIDARKAARVLYERHGYTVVKVLVSVSSPHRGSPVARYILQQGPGVTGVADALATYFGDTVYKHGNDPLAGAMQLVYDDFDPDDGQVTGMKAFNAAYPVDSRYAEHFASLLTAQDGTNVNPALYLLSKFFFDIDGDGYCTNDCGTDGIAGSGDGVRNEADDDGLVGINSQQMGDRLVYDEHPFGFDRISVDAELGTVASLDAPTFEQATSKQDVIHQDHLDVIGVGPDTFNEMEFYAAIIDFMAGLDRGVPIRPSRLDLRWPGHDPVPPAPWSPALGPARQTP